MEILEILVWPSAIFMLHHRRHIKHIIIVRLCDDDVCTLS